MAPRGIRNNNPGNIRRSTTVWRGQSTAHTDPDFVQFQTMTFGVRAMAIILLHYYRTRGLVTVREIINRWAPPIENDTDAYVNAVAAHMKVKPDDQLLFPGSELGDMIAAIIQHENGCYIDSLFITQGCVLAVSTLKS